MSLPTLFAGQTLSTGQELDDNFAALGALTPIPCNVGGTNALVLTPNTDTPTVLAYANYMQFTGIAANTNSSSTTMAVGALAALRVFKDTPGGPTPLSGGEIVADCAIVLIYDSHLDTGAGGWHLVAGGALLVGQNITVQSLTIDNGAGTGAAIKRWLSRTVTLTHTVVPANSTQDQTATLAGVSLGDQALVAPPVSLATIAGLLYTAYVPAAGSINVRCTNVTAASIVPPTSQIFRITDIGYT